MGLRRKTKTRAERLKSAEELLKSDAITIAGLMGPDYAALLLLTLYQQYTEQGAYRTTLEWLHNENKEGRL